MGPISKNSRQSWTKYQWIPYARHYNPLLIRNRSWILTIHKARILRKKPLEKMFLDFKKWIKSIQTAGYNGACTVALWILKPLYARKSKNSLAITNFSKEIDHNGSKNTYKLQQLSIVVRRTRSAIEILHPRIASLSLSSFSWPKIQDHGWQYC